MNYDFLSVSDGTGDAALMHIEADRLAGATTIDVDTVVNVPEKFIGTWGTLGSNGLITPASKRDFRGHLSGSDIIIDAMEPGSVDDGNTEGQVIIIKPNTGWADRVASFVQNIAGLGTPEPGNFSSIQNGGNYNQTSGSFTVPNGSVAARALATSAIYLGLANGPASTQGITSETDLTGCSILVTVPAGGRNLRITGQAMVSTNTAGDEARLHIKEGATELQIAQDTLAYTGRGKTLLTVAIVLAPTEGTHTYKLAVSRSAGAGTLTIDLSRSFIEVELV